MMKGVEKMERMTIVSLLDVIGELFSDEVSIAVSNTKEYIYYRPSKRIDLKIRPGDLVKEGTIAHKALHSKQKVSEFINRDVFGVPYHGMAVPFFDEGKLEGCVTAIFPALTDGKSVVTVKTEDGWIPIPFSQVAYLEAKEKKPMCTPKDAQARINTHSRNLNICFRKIILYVAIGLLS